MEVQSTSGFFVCDPIIWMAAMGAAQRMFANHIIAFRAFQTMAILLYNTQTQTLFSPHLHLAKLGKKPIHASKELIAMRTSRSVFANRTSAFWTSRKSHRLQSISPHPA